MIEALLWVIGFIVMFGIGGISIFKTVNHVESHKTRRLEATETSNRLAMNNSFMLEEKKLDIMREKMELEAATKQAALPPASFDLPPVVTNKQRVKDIIASWDGKDPFEVRSATEHAAYRELMHQRYPK